LSFFINADNVPFFFASASLLTKAEVLKNLTLSFFLQASIPRAMDKCVFPLWKAFHNGNYRKFFVMERN